MTTLESQEVSLNKSPEEVFAFLSDFHNFQKLMPEQVIDWQCTSEDCSFTIKGMVSLGMKYAEKTPFNHIKIIPNGKVPFDFDLNCLINKTENGCNSKLVMNADLNMFLKMMAEKPLTNFLNMLAEKLKDI